MSAPLTPRKAATLVENGDERVEVDLRVDPPTVSGSTVKGGDAGLGKILSAIDKREDRNLNLIISDNMRSHHIDMLSKLELQKPLSLSLEIRNNNVLSYNSAGYPAKWDALFDNKSLEIKSLDISGNSMEDSPPPHCFMDPISKSKSLQTLSMRHLRTTIENTEIRSEYDDCLKHIVASESLTSLDLTHNDLNELPEVLKELGRNISSLYLSWNELNGESLALIDGVVCEKITILHFGRNNLQESDGEYLSETLRSMVNLVELELNDNCLKSACSNVLKSVNTNITYLGLHGNQFGDETAVEMRKSLKKLTKLETFDISANSLSTKGFSSIAPIINTLHKNHKLTRIIVSDNNLGCNNDILQLHHSGLKLDVFKAVSKQLYEYLKKPISEGEKPLILNEVFYQNRFDAPVVVTGRTTAASLTDSITEMTNNGKSSSIPIVAFGGGITKFGFIFAEVGEKMKIESLSTGTTKGNQLFLSATVTLSS